MRSPTSAPSFAAVLVDNELAHCLSENCSRLSYIKAPKEAILASVGACSKYKFRCESRLTVATAEDSRIQEVRIRDAHVAGVRSCCGYTRSTEHVPITDGEVLVIEDIVKVCLQLKVGRFRHPDCLADRQVHDSESRGPEAVASKGCLDVGSGDNVAGGRISRQISNGRAGTKSAVCERIACQ